MNANAAVAVHDCHPVCNIAPLSREIGVQNWALTWLEPGKRRRGPVGSPAERWCSAMIRPLPENGKYGHSSSVSPLYASQPSSPKIMWVSAINASPAPAGAPAPPENTLVDGHLTKLDRVAFAAKGTPGSTR